MISDTEVTLAKIVIREYRLQNNKGKTTLLDFSNWLRDNENLFYSRTGLTARIVTFFDPRLIESKEEYYKLPPFIEDITENDFLHIRNLGEASWLQFIGIRAHYINKHSYNNEL